MPLALPCFLYTILFVVVTAAADVVVAAAAAALAVPNASESTVLLLDIDLPSLDFRRREEG